MTPTGLISYSNGGSACQEPSSSPSQPVASESVPPSASPSESPSTPPSEPPSASPSQDPSQPVQSESIPPSASPSPSDSTPPSASPSDSPSASPSTSPSASPSESASASPSASASQPVSSPSGSVLAETGTPQITPPPTDAVSGGSSTGSGWQLVLLAVAGMIGSLIALKPAKARRRCSTHGLPTGRLRGAYRAGVARPRLSCARDRSRPVRPSLAARSTWGLGPACPRTSPSPFVLGPWCGRAMETSPATPVALELGGVEAGYGPIGSTGRPMRGPE